MGHSEVIPLVEIGTAGDTEAEVRVWGDPASFSPQAATANPDAPPVEAADAEGGANELYRRIGHLTRTLHNALCELGYHDSLADARANLPDARQRLAYISRLTGDAAEKVLNSVDRARIVQDEMSAQAKGLHSRWKAVASYAATGQRATPAGQALVDETCAFLGALDGRAAQTNGILTEIMMAQDFHDLTTQVIRKVVTLSQELEEQLVKLLIESQPQESKKKAEHVGLDGPVVDATRTDVVKDQAGVDDLLASLGF